MRTAGSATLEAHLTKCAACRAVVDALVPTEDSPVRPGRESPELLPGYRLGRYVIQRRIGSGGMGVVYAAHDPTLDRSVALKLLRDAPDDAARDRLTDEARAMARLTHPNVVTVHETGEEGGHRFVAMELVDAVTLRAWLAAAPRSRAEVLDVFAQAALGLHAAHEAGIVHRDFKPENVLVGRAGDVHVTDFGLAITSSVTTAAAGTPGYVAPEALRGAPLDARADQFSFCVALYEALYGERPHDDVSSELPGSARLAATLGPLRTHAGATRVAAGLRRILVRGLDADPQRRWPNLRALLDALDAHRRRRRNAVLAAAAAVALALALVLGGSAARWSASNASQCTGGPAKLAPAWGPERKREVERAMLATAKPHAADTWRLVSSTLDAWAASWAAMHREACEATQLRGEQSNEVLDLRMECLRQRLVELRSLTNLLARADDGVLRTAPGAALELTPVQRCSDVSALTAVVPLPADPVARAHIEDVRRLVVESETLAAANQYAEGLALAERATAAATDAGYEPVRAAALVSAGNLLEERGDYLAAERSLFDGAMAARTGGDDETEASAWTRLVYLATEDLGKPDVAWRYARQANAVLGHRPSPVTGARLAAYEAYLLVTEGRLAEAEARAEQALNLSEALVPANPLAVGRVLTLFGMIADARGQYAKSTALLRRALEVREQALGKGHPDLANQLMNLATALEREGDYDEALALARRALDIYRSTLGDQHATTARGLSTIAEILRASGRFREALEPYEQALRTREQTLGPGHPDVALAHTNLGGLLLDLERPAEAEPHFTAARTTLEAQPRPNGIALSDALTGLGASQLAQGKVAAALPVLEKALELHPPDADRCHRGRTRFALARALTAAKQPQRVPELLAAASDDFEQAGPPCSRDRAALARQSER
ncbi:MAG: serine/threonine protein kinase [Myxococcaceae bacterium]|nr:serine/threonine protein kinase [Myxococcaceae bacterium]